MALKGYGMKPVCSDLPSQSDIKKVPWYRAGRESFQGSQEKGKPRIGLLVEF